MKHLNKFNESTEQLQKVVVYYACMNGGDGSVSLRWFLSSDAANDAEDSQSEGWGENCTGSVETFVGSDIYNKAVRNENSYQANPDRELRKEMIGVFHMGIDEWVDNYFDKFTDKQDILREKNRLLNIINSNGGINHYRTWKSVLNTI